MDNIKILKRNRGFTLMEVLITVGVFTIIGAITTYVDINNFRGDSFRSEVSIIGTALQTARINSFNNINQKKHGVAFNPPGLSGYIIFEGNTFASRDVFQDIVINSSYEVTFSPTSPTEVVFEELSSDSSYNGDITLTDPQRGINAVISINYEGKIAW